jgi:hypothetical protein
MAVTFLLYGSKCWILRRLKAVGSYNKFLHAVNGCSLPDHIRNERIREELGVKPILIQIMQYRENCKNIYRALP